MTSALRTLLLSLCLLASASPSVGQAEGRGFGDGEAAKDYADCMTLARSQPEQAFENATAWEGVGGAEAARHCAAVALLGLGHYGEAASRLQALAEAVKGPQAGLRPGLLAQAGQAWLLAAEPLRAYAVQSAALKLEPENVELWIDRAVTLATAENYWEAIDDLNEAESLAPARADILIFRASAYRFVEANDLALEDVGRGLSLDPNNPEGLLERGILRRLGGDEAGARADWLKTLTVAPGSPAAQAAQANLESLDVKAE